MNPTKKLREILANFDTAMLVTRDSDGSIHARPMFIAKSREEGEMWFITARDTDKVEEILEDAHAAVSLQSPSRYLSISGRATVVKDPQRVKELWRPVLYAWFEDRNDPRAVLIRFVIQEAEYWDQEGMDSEKYLFQTTSAASANDDAERPDADEHALAQL